MKNEFVSKKIAQLEEEKREILQRTHQEVEVIDTLIASLKKPNKNTETHHNGTLKLNPDIPSLKNAAFEAMKALGRFNQKQVASRIRDTYPSADLDFQDKSLRKPMNRAMEDQLVRRIQPSRGNKSQAIYEWIGN